MMSVPGIMGGMQVDIATPPLFRETQRFRQWFFYLPIAAVTVIVWWIFVQQVILGHPQGSNPVPGWLAWVLTMVFGFGFPAFAAIVRVVTEVRPGQLNVRLYPFPPRTIPVSSIREASVRHYSPLGEFGGWGMRINKRSGRAYNAYGNMGVQLVLSDGARVLVGSQQSEELLTALRQAGGGFGSPGSVR